MLGLEQLAVLEVLDALAANDCSQRVVVDHVVAATWTKAGPALAGTQELGDLLHLLLGSA